MEGGRWGGEVGEMGESRGAREGEMREGTWGGDMGRGGSGGRWGEDLERRTRVGDGERGEKMGEGRGER